MDAAPTNHEEETESAEVAVGVNAVYQQTRKRTDQGTQQETDLEQNQCEEQARVLVRNQPKWKKDYGKYKEVYL
nr:hypothetical protein CFP56_70870 [Quercus suber]